MSRAEKNKVHYAIYKHYIMIIIVYCYYTLLIPLLCYITLILNQGDKYYFNRAIQRQVSQLRNPL